MKKRIVAGIDLSAVKPGPLPEVAACSRRAAADGCVLLENRNATLPIRDGERVSVFGRMQADYLKSGTGSGGLVCVPYTTNILDALRADSGITVNEDLARLYAEFSKENPVDWGHGWATEPWCQKEMPLTDATVADAAKKSDLALVIVTRLAGESRDNAPVRESYLLSEGEEDMLAKVTAHFDRVAVVLNVGNIIDMKWVRQYNLSGVLYVWQGGMEGGNAAVDVLRGRVNPNGKLTDTIAYDISDYPSTAHFGDKESNLYCEDIYVGYRYFETAAPQKVLYPFGFGLSYTTFETRTVSAEDAGGQIRITAEVTNTGSVPGREVVQVYYGAPQGKLGRPARELATFAKTGLLSPGESETLTLSYDIDRMASYDDSGVTGHRFCYVLEAGAYTVYVGNDVRRAEAVYTLTVDETFAVEQLEQAMAPVQSFERMRPVADGDGFRMEYEPVPTREYDIKQRIADRLPAEIPYTGDKGWILDDVRRGACTMEQFIAQLEDDDLIAMMRGEGMCSPKVSGSGSAFGGVTQRLQNFGIPVVSTSDGPSGLRMQKATEYASLMPNGTLLACTWDVPLNEELFTYEGIEMYGYAVDTLLGPGINVHRNPMNGRNFEYFSEDPYLTGVMGAAQCAGMRKSDVTGTIKHFCANSQETNRHGADSVVSERALREIYLRPFEIAVKEGGATAVMTSYNPVNGLHSASHYDLTTTILRGEWGFDGMVMTDWWANCNDEDHPATSSYRSAMVHAQNDVYMVVGNGAADDNSQDDIRSSLDNGTLTRGELQRCAMNVCRYAMRVYAMDRYEQKGFKPVPRKENGTVYCKVEGKISGTVEFFTDKETLCEISVMVFADADPLEQLRIGFRCGSGVTNLLVSGNRERALGYKLEAVFPAGHNAVAIYGNPRATVTKFMVREI